MRVVRDDPLGLVAWLAGGTPVLAPTLPDGRHPRERPLAEMFTSPRVQGRMLWKGHGTLRFAPTGMPWSVWFFWGDEGFEGWYVNLETPHLRDGHSTYSADHVLDVIVEPDRSWRLKDEHELQAAVEQGRFSAGEADGVRADAAAAVEALGRGDPPFGAPDAHWRSWRPDPAWSVPPLPAELEPAPSPVPTAYPRVPRAEDSRY